MVPSWTCGGPAAGPSGRFRGREADDGEQCVIRVGVRAQIQRPIERGEAGLERRRVGCGVRPAGRADRHGHEVVVTGHDHAEVVGALREGGGELLDDAQDGERLVGIDGVPDLDRDELGVGADILTQDLELEADRVCQPGGEIDARSDHEAEERRAREPGLAVPFERPQAECTAGVDRARAADACGQLGVGLVGVGQLVAEGAHARLEVLVRLGRLGPGGLLLLQPRGQVGLGALAGRGRSPPADARDEQRDREHGDENPSGGGHGSGLVDPARSAPYRRGRSAASHTSEATAARRPSTSASLV
jgi:hypothetical protein